MAIQISGTNVINDSRQLENITNLKTINSQSILGTGDISFGNGTQFLGTITTTSGTSQSISGLNLTSYKFLYLIFNGVSASTTATIQILLGQSTSDDVFITGVLSPATSAYYTILQLDLTNGICTQATALLGSIPGNANSSDQARSQKTPIRTTSTTISVALSSSSFDAGNIKIYGV